MKKKEPIVLTTPMKILKIIKELNLKLKSISRVEEISSVIQLNSKIRYVYIHSGQSTFSEFGIRQSYQLL